jgi:hypothetical protein
MTGEQFSTQVAGSPTETSRDVGMHYADGYQIGFRLTDYLGDYWAADIEYSFANQPLRFTNLSPSISTLALSHSVHHFTYNVLGLPLPGYKRFRPYGEVGVGATLFYIYGSSKQAALSAGVYVRDSWKFTGSLGGGFKYLVEDYFAVTLDVKDQITGVPSYGLPPSAQVVDGQYQPGFARRGLQQNWQISFGAGFQWDSYW